MAGWSAVADALRETVGPDEARVLETQLLSRYRPPFNMPDSQALLLALRQFLRTVADPVLERSRNLVHHFRGRVMVAPHISLNGGGSAKVSETSVKREIVPSCRSLRGVKTRRLCGPWRHGATLTARQLQSVPVRCTLWSRTKTSRQKDRDRNQRGSACP